MTSGEFFKHPFPPLFNENSRVLILGSFPSVKSREEGFFYGHPQNRFWKLIALLTNSPVPQSIPEKKTLILSNGLALWDSIASCTVFGSSDSSIRDVVPNDLSPLIKGSKIQKVFCNGKLSYNCYHKYAQPLTGIPAVSLPSTSPANAAWSLDRLAKAWSIIFD